jgi:hypothetical protein
MITKKMPFAIALVLLILITSVAVGVLFAELTKTEAASELYNYPVSVGEKTYIITVRTNWVSEPEVYLPEFGSKYVSVDFRGAEKASVFFNITVPTSLIGGNISVVWKYYTLSADRYTITNNGTHNFIQMTFNHTATVEHFEIHGTEGAW